MKTAALAAASPGRALDYLALAKPGITSLVVATALVGFVLAAAGNVDTLVLAWTLAGTALCSAGAGALNMVMERDVDRAMGRTARRPVAAGRIPRRDALVFGGVASAAGLAALAFGAHWVAAAVAAATSAIYLLAYTPLKRRSPASTYVGAIAGALPPVIGWAGARGTLDPGAAALFAIQFAWQMPHFWAIAWLYRRDYARAGFPMVPVLDRTGDRTGLEVVLWIVALVGVSVVPPLLGLAGHSYALGAVALGIVFLAFGVGFDARRTAASARALFLASLAYLPALLAWMTLDRP